MRPSAILFDFDGVLVDSMPIHVEAWDRAAQILVDRQLTESQKESIVGQSTRAIAEYISQQLMGSLAWAAKLAAKKKDLVTGLADHVVENKGARQFMRQLDAAGVPYGIGSNAPREFVKQVCQCLDFGKFGAILGFEDVTRPKPAPELYLLCAKQLGVPVSQHPQACVFEDSLHGLEAGIKAGMIGLGIRSHQSAADLLAVGAQQTFLDFEDVLQSGFFEL